MLGQPARRRPDTPPPAGGEWARSVRVGRPGAGTADRAPSPSVHRVAERYGSSPGGGRFGAPAEVGVRRGAYGSAAGAGWAGGAVDVVGDRPAAWPEEARHGRPGEPPPTDAARRRQARADQGVEANARLTGATAAVLLVLFAVEGLTLLSIRSSALLTLHVFVGMLLVPPILVKIGSTSWRFVRYYAGSPAYRRKGPPPPLLRLLGPVLVVLTLVLLVSGIALLVEPLSDRATLFRIHQVSFVLWFGVVALHVLGHILDTARLAPADWVRRSRRQVRGAGARQWLLAASLAIGLVLGAMLVPKVGPWLTAGLPPHAG